MFSVQFSVRRHPMSKHICILTVVHTVHTVQLCILCILTVPAFMTHRGFILWVIAGAGPSNGVMPDTHTTTPNDIHTHPSYQQCLCKILRSEYKYDFNTKTVANLTKCQNVLLLNKELLLLFFVEIHKISKFGIRPTPNL